MLNHHPRAAARSNTSDLLTVSCSHKNFVMISNGSSSVIELTNKQTHPQTDTTENSTTLGTLANIYKELFYLCRIAD